MLTPVHRTIALPDDDGMGDGVGSIRTEGRVDGPDQATRPPGIEYPDTLEIIHRPTAPTSPSLDQLSVRIAYSAPAELEALLQQFRDERSRRRSVRTAKALIGLVAVGLLAVWLLDPPMAGGNENRAETAFPALTTKGLVNGHDYRQADAALRDRLALRQYVVKAVGETARDRMDTSLNSEVVMGSTGVPFLSEDFIFPCQYPFDAAAVDAGLNALRAAGRSTGKTITVAIAPDKSSILTSQLGRRGSALMGCSNKVRQTTEATWPDTAASPVLSTWTQLAAEQKAHPGKVFQRGDSHWTSQGALVWSHALINRLITQGEAPTSLKGAPRARQLPSEPADNDLYRLMGIAKSKEKVPVWQVIRPDVKIRAKTLTSPSGHGIAVFHSWSVSRPLITGRTLVIDDSFFSRTEGELAPYFSDLEVLHWADFLTDVQTGKVPHFDRIIVETVQRGWPQRAGWLQAGPIHDALAKELSAPSPTAPLRAR
jgi:SGNH hydrolase-like domain, acetyltransferase AlgX